MNNEEEIKALLGVTEVLEIELMPGMYQKIWKCSNLPEGMLYALNTDKWESIKGTLYGELRQSLGRSPLMGTWKVE